MTDIEFELLDALYFMVSYEELKSELQWEEELLKKELFSLIRRGWVKCMEATTEMEIEDLKKIELQYKNYNYLATKDGLFAHNSR